jgi:hypothetical protein
MTSSTGDPAEPIGTVTPVQTVPLPRKPGRERPHWLPPRCRLHSTQAGGAHLNLNRVPIRYF